MVILGFGFLMVFLRHHSYSSAALSLFITAIIIQMYFLWNGLWEAVMKLGYNKIRIGYSTIIKGLFDSTAFLIAYGAFLGKTTEFQMVIIAAV